MSFILDIFFFLIIIYMLICAYMNMRKKGIEELTSVFKALSDRTRVKILNLLGRSRVALCVCEIMDSLGESQYNVSRHLKILKNAGLVKENKEGRWVYHSLKEPEGEFEELIWKAISHLSDGELHSYSERLKMRLALRKEGRCVVGVRSKEWEKQLKIMHERR